MRNPVADQAERDIVAGALTRPAVIGALGVPFWFVLPIIGVPLVLVSVTWNILLFALIPIFIMAGRRVVRKDYNAPRIFFLRLISGSAFADRSVWGGDTVDPLGGGQ